MQRSLQLLSAGLLSLGLVLVLLDGSEGQVPAKLPQVDELKHKGYTETVKGVDRLSETKLEAKFDMVPIPGGAYLMGSPASEKGRKPDEGP